MQSYFFLARFSYLFINSDLKSTNHRTEFEEDAKNGHRDRLANHWTMLSASCRSGRSYDGFHRRSFLNELTYFDINPLLLEAGRNQVGNPDVE